MLYYPSQTRFKDKRNKVRKVTECLVNPLKRPPSNWVVKFSINGVEFETVGGSPLYSMRSLTYLLEQNKIEGAELIAGMSCNISWMREVDQADRLVPLKDLLSGSTLIETEEEAEDARRYRPPEQWGSISWDYMGWYLGFKTASIEEFKLITQIELKKLNPELNPDRGCIECLGHFTAHLKVLDSIDNISQARAWLNKTHNAVNKLNSKPLFTMEMASNKYGWE